MKIKSTKKGGDYKKLLDNFLRLKEKDVIAVFAALKGAYTPSNGGYVYISGSRKDRLLLCAHADTVREETQQLKTYWIGDVCMNTEAAFAGATFADGYVGRFASDSLGADDRAGCAMLWELWDGQHSILITQGEESGLIGAKQAVKEIGEELSSHQYAVQVDRRGERHMVFYSVATELFKKYMSEKSKEYDKVGIPWTSPSGSSSDIAHICEEVGICGVNLSAGFWAEHTINEMFFLGAWHTTLHMLQGLLAQESHERFVLPKKPKPKPKPMAQIGFGEESSSAGEIVDIDVAVKGGTFSRFYYFKPPTCGTLSKKRKKRLIKHVEKLHKKGKLPLQRKEELVANVCEWAAKEAYHKVLTLCDCSMCAEKWPMDRHVGPTCPCAQCRRAGTKQASKIGGQGTFEMQNAKEKASSGRTWCLHRCQFVGCNKDWRHLRTANNCRLGSYYSYCIRHQLNQNKTQLMLELQYSEEALKPTHYPSLRRKVSVVLH